MTTTMMMMLTWEMFTQIKSLSDKERNRQLNKTQRNVAHTLFIYIFCYFFLSIYFFPAFSSASSSTEKKVVLTPHHSILFLSLLPICCFTKAWKAKKLCGKNPPFFKYFYSVYIFFYLAIYTLYTRSRRYWRYSSSSCLFSPFFHRKKCQTQ